MRKPTAILVIDESEALDLHLRWPHAGSRISLEDLHELVDALVASPISLRRRGSTSIQVPRTQQVSAFFDALGDALFERLPPQAQAHLRGAAPDTPRVLVVHQRDDLKSPGLPWEYLCVPGSGAVHGERFVVLNPWISVVRIVAPFHGPIFVNPVRQIPPVGILMSAVCPDSVQDGAGPDDFAGLLRRGPEHFFGDAPVLNDLAVDELEDVTAAVPFGTLLHVVAHGDASNLILAARGAHNAINGARLGAALSRGVASVIFTACEVGGHHATRGIWNNFVGDLLAASKVETCVAPRYPLALSSAGIMVESMYSGLGGTGYLRIPNARVSVGRIDEARSVPVGGMVRAIRRSLYRHNDWAFGSIAEYVRAVPASDGGEVCHVRGSEVRMRSVSAGRIGVNGWDGGTPAPSDAKLPTGSGSAVSTERQRLIRAFFRDDVTATGERISWQYQVGVATVATPRSAPARNPAEVDTWPPVTAPEPPLTRKAVVAVAGLTVAYLFGIPWFVLWVIGYWERF